MAKGRNVTGPTAPEPARGFRAPAVPPCPTQLGHVQGFYDRPREAPGAASNGPGMFWQRYRNGRGHARPPHAGDCSGKSLPREPRSPGIPRDTPGHPRQRRAPRPLTTAAGADGREAPLPARPREPSEVLRWLSRPRMTAVTADGGGCARAAIPPLPAAAAAMAERAGSCR